MNTLKISTSSTNDEHNRLIDSNLLSSLLAKCLQDELVSLVMLTILWIISSTFPTTNSKTKLIAFSFWLFF